MMRSAVVLERREVLGRALAPACASPTGREKRSVGASTQPTREQLLGDLVLRRRGLSQQEAALLQTFGGVGPAGG